MRLPGSWNDRSLLLDEPFASWYTLRNAGPDSRGKYKNGLGRGKGKASGMWEEFEGGKEEKEKMRWRDIMVRELGKNYGVSLLLFSIVRGRTFVVVYRWT